MKKTKTLREMVEDVCDTLIRQNNSFQENTINKDCKSKIYERLTKDEDRISKLEGLIKGDEFNEGVFDRIEETNKKIEKINNEVNTKITHMNATLISIADTLKEEEIRKKTLASMLKIFFSVLGFVGISNVILIIKMLVK